MKPTSKGSAASTPDKTKTTDDTDAEIARLNKELHRLRSDAGRVPYMQRRLQEVERELRNSKLSHNVADDKNASPDQKVTLPEKVVKRIEALR